jgi:hypothetical protein
MEKLAGLPDRYLLREETGLSWHSLDLPASLRPMSLWQLTTMAMPGRPRLNEGPA